MAGNSINGLRIRYSNFLEFHFYLLLKGQRLGVSWKSCSSFGLGVLCSVSGDLHKGSLDMMFHLICVIFIRSPLGSSGLFTLVGVRSATAGWCFEGVIWWKQMRYSLGKSVTQSMLAMLNNCTFMLSSSILLRGPLHRIWWCILHPHINKSPTQQLLNRRTAHWTCISFVEGQN